MNLLGFELDNYPLFIDIVEIFMAMGIIYTSDYVSHDGETPRKITAN